LTQPRIDAIKLIIAINVSRLRLRLQFTSGKRDQAVSSGAKPPGIDEKEKRVRFDYIKSQFFRSVHVDGIFGGIIPSGKSIRMSIWNERWPIPKQTVHEMDEKGIVKGEIIEDRISRDAIVREVEIDLVMDVECAKQMRDWLSGKLEEFEGVAKLRSEVESKIPKPGEVK
jgi:hypothetical protein